MPDEAPAPRERLAQVMEDRRGELGLRWQDVAAAGGISVRAVQLARDPAAGEPGLRTLEGIDRGLRWEPGSARAFLRSGRDPVPAGAGPPPGPASRAGGDAAEIAGRIMADLARLGTEDPSGAQMFGEGTREAGSWDALKLAGHPVHERILIIARLARDASPGREEMPGAGLRRARM